MARKKGQGYIFKRGKTFYLQFDVNGQRKTVSLKTTNKREAAQNAKEFLSPVEAKTKESIAMHVAEARKLAVKDKVLIDKAWELFYKSSLRRQNTAEGTLNNYQRNWKAFSTWLKSAFPIAVSLSRIDLNIASEYANYLWDTGISASTYNYHIGALSTITKALMHSAGLNDNVWDHIARKHAKKQGKKRLYLNDMLKVLDVFSDDKFKPMHKSELEILFHVGIFTGMRLVDCVLLKWDNISLDKNLISLVPVKTRNSHKKIRVPIHHELKKQLIFAGENWGYEDYVLPGIAERYERNATGVRKDCMKVFHQAKFVTTKESDENIQRKQKVNEIGFHSFRHTFISECVARGMSISTLSEITGDQIRTLEKYYIHLAEENIRQATPFLPTIETDVNTEGIVDVPISQISDEVSELKKQIMAIEADSIAEFKQKLAELLDK